MCSKDRLLLKSRGRIQWNKVCVAMLPSSLALFQVNFAKLWSPPYYPFGYFVKRPLPICQLHFAKLQSLHYHVCFPSPQLHNVIWLFCQIAKSTSPCELPKWVSSCPTISGLSDWFFFSSLPKPLLPKIRLTLTLAPPRPFLPTLSLSSF
jgi:hypothetical protein